VVLTASRRQRRHREVAGTEGTPRGKALTENTNRIQGWGSPDEPAQTPVKSCHHQGAVR